MKHSENTSRNNFFRKNKNAKTIIGAGIFLIILASVLALSFISPTQFIERVGVHNGYAAAFMASLVGEVSAFGSIPTNVLLLALATAKNINPLFLGLIAGLGITSGNMVAYMLGYHSRHVLPQRFAHQFHIVVKWMLNHPSSWVIPIALFIYSGFIPLSNSFLIFPLALGRLPFWKLMIPMALGSIAYALGLTMLGAHGLAGFLAL